MGTFVSNPSETLFDDKETAPGLTLRPGWTAKNVLSADDANSLKNAANDLRDAHIALQSQVDTASTVGDATPLSLTLAPTAGVATAASREDHRHDHGILPGGFLHATVGANAGFMSAADKSKLDAITGTHTGSNTGDVTLGTANGLSLSGQALSLAAAGATAGAMSASDKTKLDAITGTHTGSNTGDVTIGTANGLSLAGQALSLVVATDSVPGAMSAADHTKLTGIASGATAGVTALGAVGASPGANAASISGTTLTLQPANASFPGLMSASDFSKLSGLSAAVSPAISISQGTPANVNLSTQGTIDWYYLSGNASNPPAITHRKIAGEHDIFNSFLWHLPASGQLFFTYSAGFTVSTTAVTDDFTATAVSSATAVALNSSTASLVGYGYSFNVKATPTTRTLKLYLGSFSCTYTITCTLTDGTTTTFTNSAGGTTEKVTTITYNASTHGQMMSVNVKTTVNNGSSPNITFICATLA